MMTGAGTVVFGQTAAGPPSSVYVAYLTASGPLGRSPASATAPSARRYRHDVFRQAKTSETLVHEIMVHGVALLATHWRTGMPFVNHADGFGSSFMGDPARWPSYQSPLRPGDFGIPALLRDCDAGHLERGLPYEREAYYGVTRRRGLNQSGGVWSPSHVHRRNQVRFLRSRAREQPGRESR